MRSLYKHRIIEHGKQRRHHAGAGLGKSSAMGWNLPPKIHVVETSSPAYGPDGRSWSRKRWFSYDLVMHISGTGSSRVLVKSDDLTHPWNPCKSGRKEPTAQSCPQTFPCVCWHSHPHPHTYIGCTYNSSNFLKS